MPKTINYSQLVEAILNTLPDRERQVLVRRNSLFGTPKDTLEKIGKEYKITRERVRQIENEGRKKVRKFNLGSLAGFKSVEKRLKDNLKKHGGFMSEDHLKGILVDTSGNEEALTALEFLLGHVLTERLEKDVSYGNLDTIWKSKNVDLDTVSAIADDLYSLIKKQGNPLKVSDIISHLDAKNASHIDSLDAENEDIVEAILHAKKGLAKNILDQWGEKTWATITPKRMTDKAYLVLVKEEKPLHFETVAERINTARFDHKKACPATVHNELILDDKYVLVGRGIYALKSWGFEEGTVSDIISKLLESGKPLTKEEIIQEVLKQRMVQKTTVVLALMNKDKFAKAGEGYTLA